MLKKNIAIDNRIEFKPNNNGWIENSKWLVIYAFAAKQVYSMGSLMAKLSSNHNMLKDVKETSEGIIPNLLLVYFLFTVLDMLKSDSHILGSFEINDDFKDEQLWLNTNPKDFIDETEITDVEFAILFNDKIPRTGALIGWVSEQINNQNFHFVSAGTISKIQLNENRHPLLSDTRLDFLLIKREGYTFTVFNE